MCKYYLYCRVSTDNHGQEFERQKMIANNSGLNFEAIFEEKISGGVKGNQRQEFAKMLELLNEDTTVVVSETSRFGRNYIDCLDMIDIITQEKKAGIKFLSNGLELKGGEKMSPYEWLIISQFFIMDEFQKRQIGYNTKVALAKKKENGVRLGKPCTISEETKAEIRALKQSKSMTYQQIADKYGVHKNTVARI